MMYLGDQAIGLITSLPIFSDKLVLEYGEYTPTTDEEARTTYLSHSLGKEYDFFFFSSNGINMINENSIYAISGIIYKNFTDYIYPVSVVTYYKAANATSISSTRGSAAAMSAVNDEEHNINTYFRFFGPSDCKLKANITYRYIIGYFKEVTSNA